MDAISKPPRQEFERKFLVIVPELTGNLASPKELVQGYLMFEPLQSRIRITNGSEAVHEFKAKDDFESEASPMDIAEAEYILNNYRQGYLVSKSRFVIASGIDDLNWELDIFQGQNKPLHLVEIEMPTKDFQLDESQFPKWVGPEVTGDRRFKNKNLAQRPVGSWPKSDIKDLRKLMGL